MNWQEVCNSQVLQNLPFKVETNKWGRLEMSPATNEHGLYQSLLIQQLSAKQGGMPISECSVQTSEGVKVADVAWASYEFFKRNGRANPYLEAPEIVVEIISPSNTRAEMNEKKELYFARGAEEFWLCGLDGKMQFFNNHSKLEASEFVPDFPLEITIDFA